MKYPRWGIVSPISTCLLRPRPNHEKTTTGIEPIVITTSLGIESIVITMGLFAFVPSPRPRKRIVPAFFMTMTTMAPRNNNA